MRREKRREKIEYELIRSKRLTIALQIKDGKVIVRAPMKASKKRIDKFVDSHYEWIEKHLAKADERRARYDAIEALTSEELQELVNQAQSIIPSRVEHFSRLLGVDYGRITIRNQISRWGSCSSSGNLSFNCLLMLAPSEVLDAIVAHELCHRLEMNHSKAFYSHLLSVYPDYYKWHSWLKQNGGELMQRNPKKR